MFGGLCYGTYVNVKQMFKCLVHCVYGIYVNVKQTFKCLVHCVMALM